MAVSSQNDKTKPEDTDFYQQRLRAWQPLLTPWYVILTFFLVAIIFVPLGSVILVTSEDVVEVEQEYDINTTQLELTIPEDMEAPVYFYYKLTNFYQNHRRYVKSRSDTQLAGTSSSTSLCDPLETYDDKILYPCGLVANSFFNDTFSASLRIMDENGTLLPSVPLSSDEFSSDNIAWKTDRENKFKDLYIDEPLPDEYTREGPGGTLPYITDQHFIVWMRTAGLPTFRKLYAVVNVDLKKDDVLIVDIGNHFPVALFDGTKSIVISTASWLGGKNYFLGFAYVVVGAICFLFALIFIIKQKACPRDLGSIAFLKLTPTKRS